MHIVSSDSVCNTKRKFNRTMAQACDSLLGESSNRICTLIVTTNQLDGHSVLSVFCLLVSPPPTPSKSIASSFVCFRRILRWSHFTIQLRQLQIPAISWCEIVVVAPCIGFETLSQIKRTYIGHECMLFAF